MKRKILIVDDHDRDVKDMCRILSKSGYVHIDVVHEEQAAIEHVMENKPDCVILEAAINGCNGFLLCRRIRDILGQPVDILILTGDIEKVDATLARKMGADNLTVKTSDYQLLLDALTEFRNQRPINN